MSHRSSRASILNALWLFLCLSLRVQCQEIQYNLSASAVLLDSQNLNVTINIFPTKGIVGINLTGNADVWFGVGFNSSSMSGTYAIVCSQDSSGNSICQENKLGDDKYGTKLAATIAVPHDNTVNNVRRVYITRNISITDADYFSFPTSPTDVPIIFGVSNTGPVFSSSLTTMGPQGTKTLSLTDAISYNLTVNSTAFGAKIVLNSIVVYPEQNIVQINATGPGDVYFGMGFNASSMGSSANPSYAIICDSTSCHENSLPGHSYGTSLTSLTNVVYDSTVNNRRTLLINRKRNITQSDSSQYALYYDFPLDSVEIPVIYAIGQIDTWSSSSYMSFNGSTYGSTNIQFTKHDSFKPTAYSVLAKLNLFKQVQQSVAIEIQPLADLVNITLTGPADKWFGIGFGDTQMYQTYSIVCSDESVCFEQWLGNHSVGVRFPQQHIVTLSDTKSNGVRTVKLSRLQIINRTVDVNYEYFYSFPSLPAVTDIIYAYGTTNTFTNQSAMANYGFGALQFNNATNRVNVTASLALIPMVNQTVSVQVLPDTNTMYMTFTGPADRWFGVGFNSTGKMNGTYAICVDGNDSVHEYILGDGNGGTRLETQNINVTSDTIEDGVRTVVLRRPAAVVDRHAYQFPFREGPVPMIAAYGNDLDYTNATGMAYPHNSSIYLNFRSFDPDSNCADGRVSYGTSGYVQNGLTVGLYIFCTSDTIQLSIEYTEYKPNWFGIVFNSQMTPSPNATVFTTGKGTNSDPTRNASLYAYNLENPNIDQVVYTAENNWRKLSQTISGSTISVVYEQDLRNTKWSTSTDTITFMYAWGDSLVLKQHCSTCKADQKWVFNLLTGQISSSSDNTIKTVHGIIMIVSWSVLTSVGIMSSRYRSVIYQGARNKALWFFVHRGVQVTVVILVLIGFSIAVYFTQHDGAQHFSNSHEILGLTVVILCVLQPINAWFRPHPPKQNETKSAGRFVWELIHKSCGYITWMMAQIAIYLGIKQLTTNTTYLDVFIVWVAVVFVIFVGLWIYDSFFRASKQAADAKARGLIANEKGPANDSGAALRGAASPNASMIGAESGNSDREDS